MQTGIDPSLVQIGNVLLLPLIIGIIEAAKRFAPSLDGRIWFAASILLGIGGQIVAHIAEHGVPATLDAWTTILVLGLAFGLAAGKAYDETLGRG